MILKIYLTNVFIQIYISNFKSLINMKTSTYFISGITKRVGLSFTSLTLKRALWAPLLFLTLVSLLLRDTAAMLS